MKVYDLFSTISLPYLLTLLTILGSLPRCTSMPAWKCYTTPGFIDWRKSWRAKASSHSHFSYQFRDFRRSGLWQESRRMSWQSSITTLAHVNSFGKWQSSIMTTIRTRELSTQGFRRSPTANICSTLARQRLKDPRWVLARLAKEGRCVQRDF